MTAPLRQIRLCTGPAASRRKKNKSSSCYQVVAFKQAVAKRSLVVHLVPSKRRVNPRSGAIVFRHARGARTAGCGQPPRPWLVSMVPDASPARELCRSRPPRRSTHPQLPPFASDAVSNFATPEAEYRPPRAWRLSLGLARAPRPPTRSARSFSAVGSRAAR